MMIHMYRAGAFLVVLCLAAYPALAQSEASRELTASDPATLAAERDQSALAFREGRWADLLASGQRSLAAGGGANANETIAVAALKMGNFSLAWSTYRAIVVDSSAEKKLRERAQNQVRSIEAQTGEVKLERIGAESVVRTGDLTIGKAGDYTSFRLWPGQARISLEMTNGRIVSRTLHIERQRTLVLTFDEPVAVGQVVSPSGAPLDANQTEQSRVATEEVKAADSKLSAPSPMAEGAKENDVEPKSSNSNTIFGQDVVQRQDVANEKLVEAPSPSGTPAPRPTQTLTPTAPAEEMDALPRVDVAMAPGTVDAFVVRITNNTKTAYGVNWDRMVLRWPNGFDTELEILAPDKASIVTKLFPGSMVEYIFIPKHYYVPEKVRQSHRSALPTIDVRDWFSVDGLRRVPAQLYVPVVGASCLRFGHVGKIVDDCGETRELTALVPLETSIVR